MNRIECILGFTVTINVRTLNYGTNITRIHGPTELRDFLNIRFIYNSTYFSSAAICVKYSTLFTFCSAAGLPK